MVSQLIYSNYYNHHYIYSKHNSLFSLVEPHQKSPLLYQTIILDKHPHLLVIFHYMEYFNYQKIMVIITHIIMLWKVRNLHRLLLYFMVLSLHMLVRLKKLFIFLLCLDQNSKLMDYQNLDLKMIIFCILVLLYLMIKLFFLENLDHVMVPLKILVYFLYILLF